MLHPPKPPESRNSDSSEYAAEIQIDILVWFKFAPRNVQISSECAYLDLVDFLQMNVLGCSKKKKKSTKSRYAHSSEWDTHIPRNVRISIWWIFWGVALWVETVISKIWMSCQWAYTHRERTYTQNSHTQRAHTNKELTQTKSSHTQRSHAHKELTQTKSPHKQKAHAHKERTHTKSSHTQKAHTHKEHTHIKSSHTQKISLTQKAHTHKKLTHTKRSIIKERTHNEGAHIIISTSPYKHIEKAITRVCELLMCVCSLCVWAFCVCALFVCVSFCVNETHWKSYNPFIQWPYFIKELTHTKSSHTHRCHAHKELTHTKSSHTQNAHTHQERTHTKSSHKQGSLSHTGRSFLKKCTHIERAHSIISKCPTHTLKKLSHAFNDLTSSKSSHKQRAHTHTDVTQTKSPHKPRAHTHTDVTHTKSSHKPRAHTHTKSSHKQRAHTHTQMSFIKEPTHIERAHSIISKSTYTHTEHPNTFIWCPYSSNEWTSVLRG